MEEEKDYSTQGTTRNGPVRPSMVVMTSKLLNVSEGIAAMNIRIACGVAFCCVLLVATFIVNILAFDYAKDNEVKEGALVDKNTGKKLTVTAQPPAAPEPKQELSAEYLQTQKDVAVFYGDNFFFNLRVDTFSISICPSTVSEDLRTKYCQEDKTYLGFSDNDLVVVFYQDGANVGTKLVAPEDQGFVTAVVSETLKQTKSTRHLLHGCHNNNQNQQSCGWYGCVDCSQNDESSIGQEAPCIPNYQGSMCTRHCTSNWHTSYCQMDNAETGGIIPGMPGGR
jgi:hypothetical protein